MSSHYLDVAVGLSYTFLAVSLLCSATRDAIASLFQTRAKVLLDGVLTLLHEAAARPKLRGVWPSVDAYRWWLAAAVLVIVVVTLVRTRRSDWVRWGRLLSFRRLDHVR